MSGRRVTSKAPSAHVEGGSGRSEASPTAILKDTHSVEGEFSEVRDTSVCMRKKMFSLPLMLVGLWWKGLTRRDLLGGRKEERHVRAGNHDTGCSGQDGRRQGPHPGADPIPTPENGRVQGVRRPGRSEQRQAYRRVLLGERGSLAGHRRSGP